MAELRTVLKSDEISDREEIQLAGALLSLPEGFVIIPHPLKRFRRDASDHVFLIIGKQGFFLVSHALYSTGNDSRAISEMALDLEHYARDFRERFVEAVHRTSFAPHLLLISPVANSLIERQGHTTILPLHQARTLIISLEKQSPKVSPHLSTLLLAELRADGLYKRVNQYQILSQLEQTHDAITFLAYDTVLERPVILREIPQDHTGSTSLKHHHLLREAKLTMQLHHENILKIEQVIPRDDSIFVVSEWIEGSISLQDFLRRQGSVGLAPDLALQIILSLSDALAYAHARGIVHRNVKPENIVIKPDLSVKLTNFGLAKQAGMATQATFDLRQMVKENPYAAPEFRLGSEGHHQVDGRVDIFSLGVLCYELLTGVLPTHLDERYWEPPSKHRPELGPRIDDIIAKAIRFDPNQRFSSITALKRRLEEFQKSPTTENSLQRLETAHRYIKRQIVKRTRNSLVYSAFDAKLSRKVALKKIIFDVQMPPNERHSYLEGLLSEARLVSQMAHPSIVSVYDYFIEDEDGYIVMEWLEGQNLREILTEKGAMPPQVVRSIGLQIGEALQYAHHQGITHRDIKPENIIYNQSRVTVLDFGLAHIAASQEQAQKTAGTARYMAPEQLAAKGDVDGRADVFSLGVVLYELLTRQYPYDPSVIFSRYACTPVPEAAHPSQINIDCPPEYDDILLRAIAVDPNDRYQRIEDLIKALYEIDQLDSQSEVLEKSFPKRWMTIALGIVCAGICVGGIAFIGNKLLPQRDPMARPPQLPQGAAQKVQLWQSHPVTERQVTLQVDQVAIEPSGASFHLVVNNDSQDIVHLLNRTDIKGFFVLTDETGHDYARYLDMSSVSDSLLKIEPQTTATGSFIVSPPAQLQPKQLFLKLKETEGDGRRFNLELFPQQKQ